MKLRDLIREDLSAARRISTATAAKILISRKKCHPDDMREDVIITDVGRPLRLDDKKKNSPRLSLDSEISELRIARLHERLGQRQTRIFFAEGHYWQWTLGGLKLSFEEDEVTGERQSILPWGYQLLKIETESEKTWPKSLNPNGNRLLKYREAYARGFKILINQERRRSWGPSAF